jgi:hypothetical protein
MTTTSIAEQLGARRGDVPTARPRTPSPTVEALRAQSSSAQTDLVSVLGYPPQWADELERRAFAAGRVWSLTPYGDEDRDADASR